MWVIPKENVDGRAFMTVVIFFLFLAFVSVSLRLCARRITRSSIDASDLTCLASLVFSVGLTVIVWLAFSHGWGLDVTKFTATDAMMATKIFPSIMIIWNTSVCMVRVSMLLFYIHLFHISGWRIVFWVFIALNVSSLISIICSALLICRPLAFTYDKSIKGGHCGDLLKLQLFTAIWNLLMDVAIVVLPMPIVWTLKMSTKKKTGVSLIFGMGIIICLMTLTRIFVTSYYMTDNFTRQNGIVAFITGLEPIVGIINACLPHFPPVFRRLGSSTFATTLSKVFNTGVSNASKNSAHTQTVGSYGRSTKNSKKSNQKSGFEQFSDSDTVELTGLADEYLGRDIQVRHDVSVRGSTA